MSDEQPRISVISITQFEDLSFYKGRGLRANYSICELTTPLAALFARNKRLAVGTSHS